MALKLISELKYRMSFPLMDYLQTYYPDGNINSSGQYVATCPRCKAEGLNNKKFYYDMKKFRGLCHRCYATDRTAGFKSLVGLIAFTENISKEEAYKKLEQYAVDDDNLELDMVQQIERLLKKNFKEEKDLLQDLNNEFIIEIPNKYKPTPIELKRFFSSRNPPINWKHIVDKFPVWKSDSNKLRKRMIFEITTNNNKAWLAYAINKKVFPKTLNPTGNILSRMLGGYNYAKDKIEPIIVTEGIFDMFRVVLRGYSAVCSFGNKLTPEQIMLLNNTNATEIVLCYDTDLNGAGWKAMWRMVKKYRKLFDKSVSLMFMDFEFKNGKKISVDPDSVSRKNFDNAFLKRRYVI